ncbi:MAG: hypothetical protein KBT12_01015 [Bacteroidales bacterium]|nr:hypothetical protein [Candidatus Physcousia equi]
MSALILPPLVRLRRFRRRCGYGVHSPYAFEFITQVIYERTHYYAYNSLDALLPRWQTWLNLRPRRLMRLIFRLANWQHPSCMRLLHPTPQVFEALKAAVPSSSMETDTDQVARDECKADLIYVGARAEAEAREVLRGGCPAMLIVDDLRHQTALWTWLKEHPRTTLTFDLYDLGIVLFDRPLNRMDYVVSF